VKESRIGDLFYIIERVISHSTHKTTRKKEQIRKKCDGQRFKKRKKKRELNSFIIEREDIHRTLWKKVLRSER